MNCSRCTSTKKFSVCESSNPVTCHLDSATINQRGHDLTECASSTAATNRELSSDVHQSDLHEILNKAPHNFILSESSGTPNLPSRTQSAALLNSNVSHEISPTAEPLFIWQRDSTQSQAIRTAIANSLREGDGIFPCKYILKSGNFFIPAEVRSLPRLTQAKVFSASCDIFAQKELEKRTINWWLNDITPTSRLIALPNRANGDCLLDSLMQASFGVVDSTYFLRQALADNFLSQQEILHKIWSEHEKQEANSAGYELSDDQIHKEWESCLKVATSRNEPLEQIHILVLANTFRRPIVMYSVVSFPSVADDLPFYISKFQGIYLPFLCERRACSKAPLVVGYTPGHFTALVPITPRATTAVLSSVGDDFLYLPLFDIERRPLSVHFADSIITSAPYAGLAIEDLISDWMVTNTSLDGLLWVKVTRTTENGSANALFKDWMNAYIAADANTVNTRQASPDEMLFDGIDVPFSDVTVTKEGRSSPM